MEPARVNVPIHYLYTESTITYLDEFACGQVTEVKLAVPKEYSRQFQMDYHGFTLSHICN